MKRLLVFIAGGLGLRALVLRRRQRPALDSGFSPADELRARIAESRVSPPDGLDETEATAEAEAAVPDPQSRRRDVHDRARDAIDELG